MKMISIMLLTLLLSLNTAMADGSADAAAQIKRSQNYSKILKSSADDYGNIARDLSYKSMLPTAASWTLMLIVIVETVYFTWAAVPRLLVCKTCMAEIPLGLRTILGGLIRVGATGTTGFYSLLYNPSIYKRDDIAFKHLDSAKLEAIQNKTQEVEFIDLKLRSNRPEALQLYKNMSHYDRQEYEKRILGQLKAMPKAFQLIQDSLNKTIENLLSQNDPANSSYFARIFKLGEDQLLFGDIVIFGALARRDASLELIKLNDNLIAEYQKLLTLNK